MPQLTTAFDAPRGPEKNKLGLGAIAPHLGEIWGFECSYFGPDLNELRIHDFRYFLHIASTNLPLSILRIKTKSLFCDSRKFRPKLVPKIWGIFDFTPLGGVMPQLITAYNAPRYPEKKLGWSQSPQMGDMGV